MRLEERGKIFHSGVWLNGAEYGSDALRGQAHTLQEKLLQENQHSLEEKPKQEVRKHTLEIACALLEDGKADANVESLNGFTALHLAALNGNAELAALLLRHHANPLHSAKVLISLHVIHYISSG